MSAPVSVLGNIARAYIERGIAVFPLEPRGKMPAGALVEHGLKQASTDAATVAGWWSEVPDANIGIATGEPSGMWVLDIDGPDGEAALAGLVAEFGPLPETPEQSTGKGRHLCFKHHPDVRNRGGRLGQGAEKRKVKGLDVRGTGGYIVAAPSVHPSGRAYQWHAERRPSKMPFAEAPDWLIDLVRASPRKAETPPAEPTGKVPKRNKTRDAAPGISPYVARALDDECREIAGAPAGSQEPTLNERTFKIGQLVGGGALSRGVARAALIEAGMRMVPSREPWTIEEVSEKVDRALDAGALSPREAPEPRPQRPAGPVQQMRPTAQPEERPSASVTPIARPAERYDPGDAWKAGLIYKDEAKLAPKAITNAILLLAHHPAMRGALAYNEFSRTIDVIERPAWEAPDGTDWERCRLEDHHVIKAAAWLESLGMTLTVAVVHQAAVAAAQGNIINPVREYLSTLVWDGTERLNTWLTYYAGVDDSDYVRAVGSKWLISAVARVMRPGAKVDTMLVLEGQQGLGKGKLLERIGTLDGRRYFTDEIADIGSKDAAMQLQGVLIVEIPEMHTLERAEVNAIKAWLSRTIDRYRPPYGRTVGDYPRQCVLAGTVNPDGTGYLLDATGARRFWPVTCKALDIDAIERDAPQLWAEAVARFRGGEPWWLDEDLIPAARDEQEQRYQEDPWAPKIDQHITGATEVQINVIMHDVLAIPTERQNAQVAKRIAKHLRSRGWSRKKVRDLAGQPKWMFVKGEEQ